MDREMLEIVSRLGSLESRVDGLEKRLDESLKELGESVDEVGDKLDTVLETLNQARGGWKVLAVLGGLAAAMFAGVTTLWGLLK